MDQVSSWTGGNEAFKIKEVFRGVKKQRFRSFFSNLTDYDKHCSKHLSYTALSWLGEHDVINICRIPPFHGEEIMMPYSDISHCISLFLMSREAQGIERTQMA